MDDAVRWDEKGGDKWSAINYLYDVWVAALRILGKQTRLIDFGRRVKKKIEIPRQLLIRRYVRYIYIYIVYIIHNII